jgi:hypothetical protein
MNVDSQNHLPWEGIWNGTCESHIDKKNEDCEFHVHDKWKKN